jgi:hypothetical protein
MFCILPHPLGTLQEASLVLGLARSAGFLEAEAILHHLQGNYARALECCFNNPRHGTNGAFEYASRTLAGEGEGEAYMVAHQEC